MSARSTSSAGNASSAETASSARTADLGAFPWLRVATAFLAIAAGLICFSSLEFMLEEIQKNFAMSADDTIVVAQISAGAALCAVFVTGGLADRLGNRRVITIAALLLSIGAVGVGVSPNTAVLLVGSAISAVGTIALAIVGLSVLNSTFSEPKLRARAFGLFAVIAPVVAIFVPLVAGAVIPLMGWRSITVLWVAVAVAIVLLARRSLQLHKESPTANNPPSEQLTPLLAGVALAGIALTFSFLNITPRTQQHLGHAVVSVSIGLVSLGVLLLIMRTRPNRTLDIRWFRGRGALSVAAVVFIINSVNLFFFTFLILQFRYHQSLFETAGFLMIPQATATIGAILSGRLSEKRGSWRVAATALVLASVLSAGTFIVGPESSPWVAVAVLSLAAIPIAAAVGPTTQSFMDLAPSDGVGAASSWRNASSNLGVAIGGVIVGAIVFNDLDRDTEKTIEAFRMQADAFHLAGLLCVIGYLVAAGFMVLHGSRRGGLRHHDAGN
ncbi:MAG: MFS transporter [Actinomycetes bacterium]